MRGERTPNVGAASRSVAGRVLSILEAFASEQTDLSLVDISRRTGLALSTTYRLTGQLCEWGALDRSCDRRYHLGNRLRNITSGPDRGPSPPAEPGPADNPG